MWRPPTQLVIIIIIIIIIIIVVVVVVVVVVVCSWPCTIGPCLIALSHWALSHRSNTDCSIPVRHSRGPLGLTLTLALTLTPGMADPRNGRPPEWQTSGMGAGTS